MRNVYSLRIDELEPTKLVVRVDSRRPLQFSEIILSLDFQSVTERAETSPEFSARQCYSPVMTLSNIRNLPTRWSWGKPRLPKDKLDSSSPQAWITEVRARKRISEVIDELPLGNILHVKLNLHAYSFFP